MKYFFIIGAFNAFFFSLLIVQKKKALHDKILIYWLIFLGLYTGTYAFVSDVLFTHFHLLSVSFISLLMLHGPFLYLYISALLERKFQFNKKSLLHFLPFFLFNVFVLSTLLFPEVSGRLRLDHVEQEHQAPWLFNFFLALTALSGPAYFLFAFKLFKDFDYQVKNNFSSREDVNPDWLRKLVYSFGAVWTVLIVFAVIHHIFNLFSWKFCTDGLFLSLSVFVIMIGYLGLKQKKIFIDYPDKEIDYVTDADTGYSNVLFEDAEANMYLKKIQGYMKQEKPYLNAQLSLPDLASELKIPSHHLSRVINERLNLNFFDFINQYRVEEVKTKIANPKFDNLSLLGIAFESGFNSKSAFNRIFKKMTGSTPSAYKKSITR